jgi:hypothetical protein
VQGNKGGRCKITAAQILGKIRSRSLKFISEAADLPSFVRAGGITQRKKRFFGNIFGASCVCIGECNLGEIKKLRAVRRIYP